MSRAGSISIPAPPTRAKGKKNESFAGTDFVAALLLQGPMHTPACLPGCCQGAGAKRLRGGPFS